MPNTNFLIIKGAREHNLKNIDIKIPRNKFIVFTGLSGSGKSSLAFDTIYAEGQRRYVESLSSYARQFLGQMEKPDVDSIEGLPPAIAIDQKTTTRNPRSTVGTVTEIHDYLRLLFARIGIPHCPKCGKEIQQQTIDQMVDQTMKIPLGTRIQILSPVINQRKGEHLRVIDKIRKSGFVRIRVDGYTYEIEEAPPLEKQKKHSIEIVVDRLVIEKSASFRRRLADSMETALRHSEGLVLIDMFDEGELLFSQNYACPDCGISIEELSPRMFSFNSPFGACSVCDGLGTIMSINPETIFPNKKLTLKQGAIHAIGWNTKEASSIANMYLEALSKKYKFSLEIPVGNLPDNIIQILLHGMPKKEKLTINYSHAAGNKTFDTGFEGIIPSLKRRYQETSSDSMKAAYEEYMMATKCPSCKGLRLKPETLAVTVGGKNIAEISDLPILDAQLFFNTIKLSKQDQLISKQIFREIRERLGFLVNVGLDYLTLSRSASSLSGGESQRIRLATQIGSSLVGVLYILDEPSIGLHQRDNNRLLKTLRRLCDLGNTVIVVEHDEETMMAADYIFDIGPGAGANGGTITAQGTIDEIKTNPLSLTGQYLSRQKTIPVPKNRRSPSGFLNVKGAAQNNLNSIDVSIPLGVITCVTGVSGSGKSSLVNEILYKYLARKLNRARTYPGAFKEISGSENLDKIINIDQTPIGRTPRSNPATYTGVFDNIRRVYASTNEAKTRGYNEGRFSFNVKGGRCEACHGDGLIKIEMHFLPDIYVPCEICKGKRYNRETLEIHYKDKSISDILNMTVEEALAFFENHPLIVNKLTTLVDVGLGYIRLGQPSTTLSGGEAQRVKLSTELSKRATGKTLYLLDEPTTGLHVDDVRRLIHVLQRLADSGNSIIIIEHNLDVIKSADFIIDMGPEGGNRGGNVIAQGTPEEISKNNTSYTGQFLSKVLS